MATTWPSSLTPASVRFTPISAQRRGAPTLLGITQRTSGDAGAWTASLNAIPVVRSEQARIMQGLLVEAVGRAQTFLISPHQCGRPPTNYSVGSGSAIRGTTLGIASGGNLKPGHFFEVVNNLYCAYNVSGNTVHFWPPLRTIVSSNAAVNVLDPRCQMRLSEESAEQALETNWTRIQFISLQFEESREVT